VHCYCVNLFQRACIHAIPALAKARINNWSSRQLGQRIPAMIENMCSYFASAAMLAFKKRLTSPARLSAAVPARGARNQTTDHWLKIDYPAIYCLAGRSPMARLSHNWLDSPWLRNLLGHCGLAWSPGVVVAGRYHAMGVPTGVCRFVKVDGWAFAGAVVGDMLSFHA